ncbi:MAG: ketol-acid reductoisomerase [Candidatus Omnitrophota bacterium]
MGLKVYYDGDANLDVLRGKKIAIIGYGIQGRGQALNLKDSGLDVIVAQREGGVNWARAQEDGFSPVSAQEAARQADVIQVLIQDHLQADLYKNCIRKHLKKGKVLMFSHGFNIRFRQIKPPKKIDVLMVAPKGPGALVRKMYKEGKGVPCLLAVHQDASGRAKDIGLAYARGIGGTRAGVIETTFAEETETDLFGEQMVLCGGVTALIKAGFETLVEAGYNKEIAYFEVLHELKLITDLIQARGISGMRRAVSNTACYGDLTRGPRVIDARTKKRMKRMLREIVSGKFAREWIRENAIGRPLFNKLLEEGDSHPIEDVGRKLREMMPWMEKDGGK